MQTARDTVGPDVELMVDAGGSDAYWPHGYKWALRTAQMLAAYDVVWFEEALPPTTWLATSNCAAIRRFPSPPAKC